MPTCSTHPQEQEAALRDAMALAERQSIPLYELRAAVDLADLIGDDSHIPLVLEKFPAEVSFDVLDAARARVSPS